MDHRARNLFAVASSVVSLSAASAKTTEELASAVRGRLAALARAHALTMSMPFAVAQTEHPISLHRLIRTLLEPYDPGTRARVTVSGPDVLLSAGTLTNFALLLHEFATNASKYGALSTASGCIDIDCLDEGEQFVLTWKERGGPPLGASAAGEGFGSLLARMTVNQLRGEISRDWQPDGLTI